MEEHAEDLKEMEDLERIKNDKLIDILNNERVKKNEPYRHMKERNEKQDKRIRDLSRMEEHVESLKDLESELENNRVDAEKAKTSIAEWKSLIERDPSRRKELQLNISADQRLVDDFDHRVAQFQIKLKDTLRAGIRYFQHHSASFSTYKFVRRLGVGSYGYVDEVLAMQDISDHNQITFARKAIQSPTGLADDAFSILVREFWVLKDLHKLPAREQAYFINVSMAYTINLDTDYSQYFLLMFPAANGGNLTKFLNDNPHLSATSLFQMMGCLVTGLAILHKACIRHHDIHPGNVLIDDGKPIYTDFGFAVSFKHPSNSRTHNVTHRHQWQYAAPERERGTKSDVFALGGVLYDIAAVLTGDKSMLEHQAMNSNTQFGDKEGSSIARKSLDEATKHIEHAQTKFWLYAIAQMLDFDPAKRPSAKELFTRVVQTSVNAERESSLCETCESVARLWGLIPLSARTLDLLGTGIRPRLISPKD